MKLAISRAISTRFAVSPMPAKNSACAVGQISGPSLRVPPTQRGVRVVTNVGAGCDGRVSVVDERCSCGRRSRVVLVPRRWDQALWCARRRWLKSPVHRGEHEAAVNTNRAGKAGSLRLNLWCLTRVLTYCTRGRGCNQHPAFPAPDFWRDDDDDANPDAIAPRKCRRSSFRGA
jgi:hypothetical protein